jgi:hypothetical protein
MDICKVRTPGKGRVDELLETFSHLVVKHQDATIMLNKSSRGSVCTQHVLGKTSFCLLVARWPKFNQNSKCKIYHFRYRLKTPVQCKQDHHKNCWDCGYAQAKFLLNNQRTQKSRGAHKSNNSRDQDVFLTARV